MLSIKGALSGFEVHSVRVVSLIVVLRIPVESDVPSDDSESVPMPDAFLDVTVPPRTWVSTTRAGRDRGGLMETGELGAPELIGELELLAELGEAGNDLASGLWGVKRLADQVIGWTGAALL